MSTLDHHVVLTCLQWITMLSLHVNTGSPYSYMSLLDHHVVVTCRYCTTLDHHVVVTCRYCITLLSLHADNGSPCCPYMLTMDHHVVLTCRYYSLNQRIRGKTLRLEESSVLGVKHYGWRVKHCGWRKPENLG
ncbi:uncharacterized protein LOC135463410 [Liolophura sinensis]|uniref:uncharacterized protein LOC135463410 n=1 Tax=Liolophura sinensis TaxID=3198878 RepID=UPI003159796E